MAAGGESLRDAWDEQAENWVAWARTLGHDHFYWRFNLPRFLELVPPPGRLTVDLGSGEGRLGRRLESGRFVPDLIGHKRRMKKAGVIAAILGLLALAGLVAFAVWQSNERTDASDRSRGPVARTKEQLYAAARARGIKGRSKMSKEELEEAVGH